jgi:HEAT repeat protein
MEIRMTGSRWSISFLPRRSSRRAGIVMALALTVLLSASVRAKDGLGKRLRDADPEVRSAAVREVRETPTLAGVRLIFPLLEDEDDYVRDLTWATLGSVKEPEFIRWIGGAILTSRSVDLRREAIDALGFSGAKVALPILIRTLDDREPQVRIGAAVGLGRQKGAEAARALRTHLKDKDLAVRAAVLESLSRVDAVAAVGALQAALRDSDEGIRCVALRSLRYGNRELAIEVGAWALREGGWRLRAQAIENALWLKDRSVMEGLITAIPHMDRARVKADLFDALRTLTGLEIPPTQSDWDAWWEQHGAQWRKGGRIKLAPRAAAASAVARYYGIPVKSDRVSFLLDGSGSMRGQMATDDPRIKMDTARTELLRTLDLLGTKIRYNVIVFQTEPEPFRPALVAADARTRKRLEAFIRLKIGKGWTNVHDALVLALQDPEVDTIFILSDGAPSRGEHIFRSRILEQVRRINRRRKVVIHTISFAGKARDRKFLKDLAERNGGMSVVSERK